MELAGLNSREGQPPHETSKDPHDDSPPIQIDPNMSFFRKFLKFAGAGLLISIGCLDPGNLSGDIAVAQQTRMRLYWFLVLAHLMAYVYQSISVTIGRKSSIRYHHQSRSFKHDQAFLPQIDQPVPLGHGRTCSDWRRYTRSNRIGYRTQVADRNAHYARGGFHSGRKSSRCPLIQVILQLQNFSERVIEGIFAVFLAVMAGCFAVNYFYIG
jgi:hypothetical protein